MSSIPSGGWTGPWLEAGGHLFVTVQQVFGEGGPDGRKGLMRIDPVSMTETGFADLPQGANSLAADRDGKIWVLCDGGIEEETGGLFRVDPVSLAVERSLFFPSEAYSASALQINRAGSILYFLRSDPEAGLNAQDLFRMPVDDAQLPESAWLAGEGRYLYSFHVDEDRSELLVTDAIGLIQEGVLYRYALPGLTVLGQARCGIFPGGIYPR